MVADALSRCLYYEEKEALSDGVGSPEALALADQPFLVMAAREELEGTPEAPEPGRAGMSQPIAENGSRLWIAARILGKVRD